MNKIRKGDNVIVIAGKDKGKRGAVLRCLDDRQVLVEGINKVKRHTRPNPVKGQPGGILEKEMPIHVSNVALINPATQRADRSASRRWTTAARSVYSSRTAKPRKRKEEFMARLQEYYKQTVMAELIKKFGYKSVMEVPRITKITLNMGVGEAVGDKKILEHAVGDMTKIAGQKPVTTKSKKSIAGFKIREGYPIGCMVTLRGGRHVRIP
jgi:ribosomal protein L24